MATISDQLAADIHNAFSKYYTDLANQDQIFFGVGDVQITRQDGSTATIRSWNKVIGSVDTAAQRGTSNTFTALQTFSAGITVSTGSINCSADNSMIVLGKNTDLALLKKQGQGGTIAVGSGTPFKIQRANTAAVAVSSKMEDIFVIGVDKQTTLPGALAVGGNIDNTSKGKVLTQAIELSMSTPYIDFHYINSTADYTARLIHDRQNRLNAQVQSFWVTDGRITASSTMPANPSIGTQLTSNPVRSLMAGRGAYGDVDGAYVQMYMEEQVGTEHRLVLYADGFGRTDAWIFRAGGTISTGKGDVMTTGSDVRLKEGFTEAPHNALQRVERLGVCEYQMKGENRRRRGFIAQQADTVDTTYTFMGFEQEIDGEKFQVMNVDYVAIIADLVSSVQELRKQLSDLMEMNKQINCHSTGALNQ
ncbi:TPA: tail fiber domain-containing protein [Klebsiella variicola subsp. variicola]